MGKKVRFSGLGRAAARSRRAMFGLAVLAVVFAAVLMLAEGRLTGVAMRLSGALPLVCLLGSILAGCAWLYFYCLAGWRARSIVVHGDEIAPRTLYKGGAARFWAMVGMSLAVLGALAVLGTCVMILLTVLAD